ncbi:MAG TPA: transglycosylase domain-containing protein [Intrasporangium sp.]|uniref:transglycosylase domain-containing protein n=1 Tax=Intrasporangium sp. TaxID=1925024 RepID=UPI002B4A0880|nr:transglycosylase domain-containing protein [Intrasporangium sp.]HKX68164.1 transglycosylase domain-containing protein [Intrasporangium sp.]
MTQSRREIRAAQVAEEKRTRRAGAKRPNSMHGEPTDDGDALEFRAGGHGGRGDGDGDGRRGWRRWVIPTLKWGSLAGIVLFVLGIAGIWFAYSQTSVPEPNEFVGRQVSIIYYSDGKTEIDRIVQDEGNRQMVELAKVPDHVQKAHIAAEDRTFYVNNGISVGGIFRAVKTSITGETQVGGSTITQQYVKNYFLSQDRTLERKAKEILIAMKIDGEKSKDEILGDYLNTIYYGRGAYGIQTASQAYFGKSAEKLTVAEGAVLASVINAPSLYDPAEGDKAAANLERRYAYVLDGMVEEGWLSAAERAKVTELPEIKEYKGPRLSRGTNGYITAEVKKELVGIGLTDQDVAKGGLRIVTTIDRKAQSNAVKSMGKHLPKGLQGGLVAIKPGDGAVIAMYGGSDYSKRQLNNATQAIMQGGSNFKPFTVLAAVREGISTKTKFDGNSPKEFDGYPHPVNNYDDRDYGKVDMRRMIGRSINTAFVELNEEIGPDKTRQAAIDAGIPEKTPGLEDDLGNVLGTASPHVIDMASAYSTIAAQGVRATPYLIAKVTTPDGSYTYTAKPDTRRAFAKEVTADVTDTMTYTTKPGGTATKVGREFERPVASKTGTSEENLSKWFSGFVPQMAVSVGTYKPTKDGSSSLSLSEEESVASDGSTIPANIWLDFMVPTFDGVEVLPFPDREGVGDDDVPTETRTQTEAPATEAPTTTSEPPRPTTTGPTTPSEPTKTPPGKPKPPPTTTIEEPTITGTVEPDPTTTTTKGKPGSGDG